MTILFGWVTVETLAKPRSTACEGFLLSALFFAILELSVSAARSTIAAIKETPHKITNWLGRQ